MVSSNIAVSSLWRSSIGVVAIAAVIMFTQLGAPRLWDRDEPRNAGCAAEMLDRNDWVTPVFNGELRSHKPVLLYWLMMPGYALFGVNEFTARLPSALLAVGTCWLTLWMGRRLFNVQAGWLAAIALSSTMMFVVAGRAATPDAVLIFFTTAAMAVFVWWAFPYHGTDVDGHDSRRTGPQDPLRLPWRVAVAVYGLMGVAMLAKGPVGLVLPTAVVGMFLLLERLPTKNSVIGSLNPETPKKLQGLRDIVRCFAPKHFLKTCWWMRPITALAVSLTIALPWYIWVGVRTDGAWLQGFFLEHNLGRALRSMESHGGGPWYYPLALLAGFFPWSIFAGPTMLAASRASSSDSSRRGVVFCACWICVYVGLFSIARTKLPSYVTPCYPALALLTAWHLDAWRRQATRVDQRWLKAGLVILAIVGVAMMIGLPIAAAQLLPGEQWLGLGGAIPFAGAIVCWRHLRADRRGKMIQAFAVASVVLVLVSFAWLSQHVSKHQQFDLLLAAIQQRSEAPRIATFECMEPSWVFYSRGAADRIERVWFANEQSDEMLAAEENRPQWSPDPPRQDLQQFVQRPDRFIITTQWQYDRIKQQLPSEVAVIARAPLFLKKTDLLLLHVETPNGSLARVAPTNERAR